MQRDWDLRRSKYKSAAVQERHSAQGFVADKWETDCLAPASGSRLITN
jgi:hypothetical protein